MKISNGKKPEITKIFCPASRKACNLFVYEKFSKKKKKTDSNHVNKIQGSKMVVEKNFSDAAVGEKKNLVLEKAFLVCDFFFIGRSERFKMKTFRLEKKMIFRSSRFDVRKTQIKRVSPW